MKTLLLLLVPSLAQAVYFRPIDLSHPQLNAGAYVDVGNLNNTAFVTAIAIITHSVRDGCALPTIVCEDWTPLAVGFSANSGKVLLGFGPSVNLAPIVKAGLFSLLTASTDEDNYTGLKNSLSSVPLKGPDITMSFGPAFVLSPAENWSGYFRMFAGGAWKF